MPGVPLQHSSTIYFPLNGWQTAELTELKRQIKDHKVYQGSKIEGDKAFYDSKIQTAEFFMTRMLPEADARFKMVMAGAKPLMQMEEAAF